MEKKFIDLVDCDVLDLNSEEFYQDHVEMSNYMIDGLETDSF